MEFFRGAQTSYRFLVCSDVDGNSASKLAEFFVPTEPRFDAVFLCGPFTHSKISNEEEKAVAEGDIASVIAQFENIVCRVIYLPSEYDPPEVLINQLHLTPNSVNVHARRLNLAEKLYVMGFSEKGEKRVLSKDKKVVADDRDRSNESDDELEDVEVASSTSVSIIKELLAHGEEQLSAESDETPAAEPLAYSAQSASSQDTGIFMLNYRFSHTLNQLLFHMQRELDSAGTSLMIISSVDCAETARLPVKFGKLHIAAPKSLRDGGHYVVVNVSYDPAAGKWSDISIEACQLLE